MILKYWVFLKDQTIYEKIEMKPDLAKQDKN